MMNEMSVNQATSLKWTFCQDVVRYAALGCSSIGLLRHKLADIELDDAAELLYEMKLSVSSLSWIGGFTGEGAISFSRAIEDALETMRAAALLQAHCVLLNPGSQNGHTRRNARRLLCLALDELVPAAEDLHVPLVIEPMPPFDGFDRTMLDGWRETLDYVTRYPARWLGIVLDLFHVGDDEALLEKLPEIVQRIGLVQLADRVRNCRQRCRRLPLGRGGYPLDRWLLALRELDYEGPLELELYGEEVRGVDYASSIQDAIDYLAQRGFIALANCGTKRHA